MHRDGLTRADSRRTQQLRSLFVIDRRGDMIARNIVHIRCIHIAEDQDRLCDAVFAQLDRLRHGRGREIRRAHRLQALRHRHSAVPIGVCLDHAQHRRLGVRTDHTIIMFDRAQVNFCPGAVFARLHVLFIPKFMFPDMRSPESSARARRLHKAPRIPAAIRPR